MKGKLFQIQTAFAASFGQFVMGLLNVWPSYTSSILASNDTTPLSEPLTTVEESLLGSLPSLGAMVGTALVGILIDKLGRRNGGVVLVLPFVISWSIISVTKSKALLLAARCIGGLSGGATLVYGPIFISEVAEDSFRGTLASGPLLMYCSGVFSSYILGWTLSYYAIIWVNIMFSVVIILLILSVKESPVFLLKQNREQEALASIAHYRGCAPLSMLMLDELTKLKLQLMPPPVELISITEDVETKADLTKAEEAEKEKLNTETLEPQEQKKMSTIKLLFMSPTSRRAFLVVMTVLSMQVLMGAVPVQVFAKSVFQQSDPAKADMYTVIFALVLTCGSFVPTVVADKAGRRFLLISSSVMVCVCMTALGYLVQTGVAPPWVTVFTLMLYCFFFMFGAGTIPYLLLAEVFVSEVQNVASMIIIEMTWFLNFAIIAAFPIMNSLIGIHGTFYFFALMAIINAVMSFFIVPETKGLSNEQIQDIFLGRTKK